MRFLLSSCCLLLLSCTSAYKALQPADGNVAVLETIQPQFRVALYKAQVEVLNNYLSGLLLIKQMPDSSLRIVFSNEMGIKFFDFGFDTHGFFTVHSVMAQLDKKAVITTLQKDFQLLLMNQFQTAIPVVRGDSNLVYYSFERSGDYYHYITQRNNNNLIRMERSSKRKPVTQVFLPGYQQGVPDSINIQHLNFKFTIGLKRLEQ